METTRIALANWRYPKSAEESVALALAAIAAAGIDGARADVVCFPECYVPSYPWPGRVRESVDAAFLERAWAAVADAAARENVVVILGTERIVEGLRRLTALVINADGSWAGFQDKVQLDPSEDRIYESGEGRRVFRAGPITFGVVICHEGWRYPETVRAAARQGAQIVFHPFYDESVGGYVPTAFADPANTFHEKAILCRAAENTCYIASVNCATPDVPITSAIAAPDGTLVAYQPYGVEGLLVADLDLSLATGLLARRCHS